MSLPRHLPPVDPEPELLALFERLAPLYCADNGRPAWDPVRCSGF